MRKTIFTWFVIADVYKDGSWINVSNQIAYGTIKEARADLLDIRNDYPKAVIFKETRQIVK